MKKQKKASQITTREVERLRKTIRELTRERDLYRKEWQKAMEDVVPFKITPEEADAIRRDQVTLDGVLAEIAPRLRKKRTA